ncbi:MAG: hypothetical protein M3Y87_03805 [Myxococcota bacterium]|nr:hypothetical protein [Myxococcota bacterium]
MASRVGDVLRRMDVDGPAAAARLCVVAGHTSGAPTPLVEDLASLADAIAIARALHEPLGHAVDLDVRA